MLRLTQATDKPVHFPTFIHDKDYAAKNSHKPAIRF